METLWTFKTRNFRVELACEPETDPDLSWADAETLRRLETGSLENICFRVRVTGPNGCTLATEYLGNSIYADVHEFRDHIGAKGKYGSYFVDMVKTAIDEARNELRKLQAVYVRKVAA